MSTQSNDGGEDNIDGLGTLGQPMRERDTALGERCP